MALCSQAITQIVTEVTNRGSLKLSFCSLTGSWLYTSNSFRWSSHGLQKVRSIDAVHLDFATELALEWWYGARDGRAMTFWLSLILNWWPFWALQFRSGVLALWDNESCNLSCSPSLQARFWANVRWRATLSQTLTNILHTLNSSFPRSIATSLDFERLRWISVVIGLPPAMPPK